MTTVQFDSYAQVRTTRGGRFLVESTTTQNGGTVYMPATLFDSIDDAVAALRDARDAHLSRTRQAAAAHAADVRFTDSQPGLVARQLAWQAWRADEYDRRVRNARNAARIAMAHWSDRNAGKTARHWRHWRPAANALGELDDYYRQMCPLDTATKGAIREHDADAWSTALDRCDEYRRGALPRPLPG